MSRTLRLAAGDHVVELDIAGDGRAVSWLFGGEELLRRSSEELFGFGMYAMGPWAGRVAGNAVTVQGRDHPLEPTYRDWALHGTVVGGSCVVVAQGHGEGFANAVVDVDLGVTWPWPGTLRAHWQVDAETVRTRLELTSLRVPFPGVIGWHPWFRRSIGGSSAAWSLEGALMAERDDDYVLSGRLISPTRGAGTFDDAFRTLGVARVTWPGVIDMAVENSAPWFVVYDMPAEFFCVEPQSGPPNGVNDGLGDPIVVVEPGRPLVLDTIWRLSHGQPARGA